MNPDLISSIKTIQRAVGAQADGVFGPSTAQAVLAHLANVDLVEPAAVPDGTLDERSLEVIATLDPKAQPAFVQFLHLAKATAASMGCDYRFIQGNRTWAQQDALYAQGRTAPGQIVTKARGGQSNHNFGIAADACVFRGGVYLDDGSADDQKLAERVHEACAAHASSCGLDWGGSWKAITDEPHYQIHTDLTLAQERDLYQRKGSVL